MIMSNMHTYQFFANKSILVTGCNGFLGKALMASLIKIFDSLSASSLSWSHSIFAIDNGITSALTHNNYPSYVTYQEGNAITFDYGCCKSVDIIFHLAGLASPAQYKKYPLETIDVAVNLTRILLRHAVDWSSKFIFFSSSEIYGNPDANYVPTPETYNGYVSCLGPRACYDESKRMGETLCYVFNNYYNVDTAIIRPFNVYGPGMGKHDYRMVPNLMRAAIEGKKISLYGKGTQTRTFCYLDDAITGILLAAEHGHPGDPYNIGTDTPEISMIQLIDHFNNATGSNIEYDIIDYPAHYPADEPMRRCPDISKAKSHLGYSPSVELDQGLRLTYDWACKAYLDKQ